MTASEFISEITKPGYNLKIERRTISDRINLNTNIRARGVILKDCTFQGVVVFDNVDLNCGIVFEHCTFEETLSFNKCTAKNIDTYFNFDDSHLRFINETSINGLFFNKGNIIDRGIRISDGTVINQLKVEDLNVKLGGFLISDSTINIKFDLFNSVVNNDVRIQKSSKINCKLRVLNLNAGALAFSNSGFQKDVHVNSSEIPIFNINNCDFTDDLYLERNKINSDLTLIDNIFRKSIFIQIQEPKPVGFINKIYIRANKIGENCIIDGYNSQINELKIESSKQLDGSLHLNSCYFIVADLTGENYDARVVFNHCRFNKLSFDFFNNYSSMTFISPKAFGEHSEINIVHSNLGKTHFYNAFLNTFDNINIFNSVLIEIIVANVKWFDPKKLNTGYGINSEEYEQKREVFRQIKTALENQGDRITALKFKALEMKAFKDQSFSKVEGCRKFFSNDRFILFAGQSNNFGQSWLKPVLITIPIIIVFYIFIVIGISEQLSYCPNFTKNSIETTWNEMINHSYILPRMFNPTSNLADTLPENTKLSFVVSLFDYLSKIVLAFFIFQIVSAFRKFMK